MTRIVLDENDQVGALVMMNSDLAAALETTRLLEVRPEPGIWRVVPRLNMVGAVRVADFEFEVRPKAGFHSLLFMLGFAGDPGIQPDDIEAELDSDVWSLVAEWCARLTERALAAGVLQGYRAIGDSLPIIRGRIDFGTQLAARPHALIPLALTYDDYTADIYENRLLRTALRRASWLPRIAPELRGRLRHLDRRLESAEILTRHRPGDWHASRANARYVPAMRFADLLLQGIGLDVPAGGSGSFAFAVDFARVFEDFLVAAVIEACEPHAIDARHHPGMHLDEARRLAIAPDIGLFDRGQMTALLDAKYKLGGVVGDLYQMLAYCTVSGLNRGWLVYAGSRNEYSRVANHRVVGSDVTITQWPLDAGVPPRELLRQVADLVAEVVSVARGVDAVPTGEPEPGLVRPAVHAQGADVVEEDIDLP